MTPRQRAGALFKTALADYAKHKRAAERTAAKWQWATRETTDVHPTWFATLKIKRGRRLPGKPAQAGYVAHEGFDADGRLVVQRSYVNHWDNYYEKFITYAPGEIVSIRYYAKRSVQSVMVMAVDDKDRVTSIEWANDNGRTTIKYTFDERGFYATQRERGGARDGTAFDFDCNDKGKIIRTWWIYAHSGERVLYQGKK